MIRASATRTFVALHGSRQTVIAHAWAVVQAQDPPPVVWRGGQLLHRSRCAGATVWAPLSRAALAAELRHRCAFLATDRSGQPRRCGPPGWLLTALLSGPPPAGSASCAQCGGAWPAAFPGGAP
jgi:hypothetical protein